MAARALLGQQLVRDDETGLRIGRIVEVEAYGGPDDQASHARFGSTARNAVMYGPAGVAYVYLVYGMYDCLNVVTGPTGEAAAVLIRAVAPLAGIDLMRADRWAAARARRRRLTDDPMAADAARARLAQLPSERLASGPGVVGGAFGLTRAWTGTDLCDPAAPLRLEPGDAVEPSGVASGPRVGVDYAGPEWSSRPWRFWLRDHPSVSRPAR